MASKAPSEQVGHEESSFIFRDDIIQFSHQIINSSRNKFRKKNHAHRHQNNHPCIEIPLPTTHVTSRSSQHLQESKPKSSHQGDDEPNLLAQRKSVDFHAFTERKKNSFTTSAQKRYMMRSQADQSMQVRSVQLNRSKQDIKSSTKEQKEQALCQGCSLDNIQGQEESVSIINKLKKEDNEIVNKKLNFSELERKHNRVSGVKDNSIESWLNEALVQASPQLEVRKNSDNTAIREYGIDRSSLLSKGINPENIGRLYRSLFVYSIGFNNFLKEMCREKLELQKSIWKAFAVLLEYCSGGDFETMIGQIERDKGNKLGEMKEEIEKRQNLIQKSDEIHEEKNRRMLKNLRAAEEETKKLQEEKIIILEDFHEAEQSFNQEIMLRLKYENRINEIHGVFEELRQKHASLKESYDQAVKTIHHQEGMIMEVKNQLINTTVDLEQKERESYHLKREKEMLEEGSAENEKKLRILNSELLTMKGKYEKYNSVINEKERKLEQALLDVQASKKIEKSITVALLAKNQQYRIALQENSSLHQKLHIQSEEVNALLQQMRENAREASETHANYVLEVRKNEDRFSTIVELRKEIKRLEEETELHRLNLEKEVQKAAGLQNDLKSCHESIKEMKEKQNQTMYSLDEALKKINLMEGFLQEKTKKQEEDELEIEKLKHQMSEMRSEINLKDSKMVLLEERLNSETEILKTKLDKARQDLRGSFEKCKRYEEERDGLMQAIETNRIKYEEIFNEYKNEKFERNNLDLRYQQSLTVLQEGSHHTKDLNIQISLLKDHVSELTRKNKNQQFVFKEKETVMIRNIEFWKNKHDEVTQEMKGRRMHVHAMRYEDLHSEYIRKAHALSESEKQKQSMRKKMKKIELEKVRLEENCKMEKRKAEESTDSVMKEEIIKRENEINFLKDKNTYKAKQLVELEQKAEKMRKQQSVMREEFMVREMELMEKVNDKNLQIQQLNVRVKEQYAQNDSLLKESQKATQKIEILENQIKNISRESPELGMITGKKKPFIQNTNSKTHDAKAKERKNEDQQRSEEYDEDEYMSPKKNPHHPNIGMGNEKCLDDVEEAPKHEREGMRKKIKGAYLYYNR